jgi:hypothetical protein
MLKWTVPLWRRWDWQRWRRAYITQTPREERRAWLRYPSPQETSSESTGDALGCPATVKNISLGGMSLLVNQHIESGTLLKVEVQSPLENTPNLLCVRVIHVAVQSDGHWSLGCAFARELNDRTLNNLPTANIRVLPARPSSWLRRLLGRSTLQVPVADLEPCSAKILNVSTVGAGLMVPRCFDRGTPLCVELPLSGSDTPTPVKGQVVYSCAYPSGEWVIGCAFDRPLTSQEVQALR